MVHVSHSITETQAIAAKLAKRLVAGDCVALEGELGAGKTLFVRALTKSLGANPLAVVSPTFVLLNIYRGGRLTVFHLDAYRIRAEEDFEAIGFNELLDQGGVVVVEWADRVRGLLPRGRIWVKIEVMGARRRRVIIEKTRGAEHRR